MVVETLDIAVTVQALLAYVEGVLLLAKGRNGPAVIQVLRMGALSVIQYQGERTR